MLSLIQVGSVLLFAAGFAAGMVALFVSNACAIARLRKRYRLEAERWMDLEREYQRVITHLMRNH